MTKLTLPLLLMALAFGACPEDEPTPGPTGDATADVTTDAAGDATTGDTTGDATTDGNVDAGPTAEQQLILGVEETESYTLPGLSAPVHVLRVEGSIPHIYAANRNDTGRAMGFVVARDRFLIMDLQRRLGRGTLSALLGDLTLENDMEARYSGFADTTQKVFETFSDEHVEYLAAWVEGVNAYIAAAKAGTLPTPSELDLFAPVLGFASPGDMMEEFTVLDVAAMVAVVMYETNWEGGDPGDENRRLQYEAGGFFDGAPDEAIRYAGAQQLWDEFAPPFPFASANQFGVELGADAPPEAGQTGIPGAPRQPGMQQTPDAEQPAYARFAKNTGAQRRPTNAGVMARALKGLESIESRLIRDPQEGFGSNAWAVKGSVTTNGMALVAGDGHLPLSIPALFYSIGLDDTVFGDGDTHQTGMLMTALPLMAVGTNGKIGWSQVNPVTDNTDWYREELQLDANGAISHTRFNGEWREVVAVTEEYVVADVPTLGSTGRTETWVRYQTFDGRRIYSIEGTEVGSLDDVPAGSTAVNVMGTFIIPGDEDGDGAITALSYDWAGFDSAGYMFALDGWGHANNVEEMRVLHPGQIGGGLYTAAADSDGNILFSSYQALPCRTYLQRNADGTFPPGSNPTEVLDGTVYGGFTIPTNADGLVDEDPGQTDPYKCVVPLAETPQAINPDSGYVVTANNQPAPITDDGLLFNEPWYIGGPWSSIRADSIAGNLADHIAAGTMDLDAMKETQAHNTSRTATMLAENMLTSLAEAKGWAETDGPLDPWQQRAADIYTANSVAMDEVLTRLNAWKDAGYQTASGVETFYNTPTAQDLEDAVATMIWNAWMPRFMQQTFDDEGMGIVWRWHGSRQRLATIMRMLDNRGPGNAGESAHYNPATEESVYFDNRNSVDVERSHEIIVQALADGLAFLSGPTGSDGESGGFDTTDMSQWLWGMRHMTRFESLLVDFIGDDPAFGLFVNGFNLNTDFMPLADDIPAGDPRGKLSWFPRPGDNYGVDAANPGFSGTKFTHGSGPVMRMVIGLKDGQVEGYNVLPGGQSMIRTIGNDEPNPYYADQAKLWLANETWPMRFTVQEVVEGATHREVLNP